MYPDLTRAIEHGLRRTEPDHEWDQSVLHVSDLGAAIDGPDGKCTRQLWLRLRGADRKPHTLGQVLMFDHGNRIHERMGDLLVAGLPGGGEVLHVEKKVDLNGITGRLDTMLVGGPMSIPVKREDISVALDAQDGSDERIVVDWKTVRGNAFRYMDGPKPMNVLQLQAYMMAEHAGGGILVYIDREGQNFVQQYNIPRDDKAVRYACGYVEAVKRWAYWSDCHELPLSSGPSILQPILKRNENKGPDSIKLEMPWQCSYCEYCDVSCPGALEPEYRRTGIIGHINDYFLPKKGCEDLTPIVHRMLRGEKI